MAMKFDFKFNPILLIQVATKLVGAMVKAERVAEIIDNEKCLAVVEKRDVDVPATVTSVKQLTGITVTEDTVREVIEDKSIYKLNFVYDIVCYELEDVSEFPLDSIEPLINALVPILFPKK